MRKRQLVRLVAIAVSAAGLASGQGSQALLSHPSLGLVFDSKSGELRLIEGNPGAASLSEPIGLSERLALAAIIPDGRHAIGVEEGSGAVVLISPVERREISNALPGPAAIRISRSGQSAALFYADGHAQILSGLPSAPALDWQVYLGDTSATGIVADISDDGNTLIAADGGVLRSWRRSGERSEVFLDGAISFATFLADSGDILAVADEGLVWAIRGGEPSILVSSQDPIISAAAFADRIGLVTREGVIAIAGRDGEMLGEMNCSCRPDGLEALNGMAVFRLTGPETGTVWMLDLGAQSPRLLFAARAQRSVRGEVQQ